MTKEQFDKLYVGNEIAVHCDTKKKAIKFLELANNFGYKWNSGDSLREKANYDRYREETCYTLPMGQFCTEEFYKQKNYKIVKFQPSPKDLLEDGFRVVYRDGVERYVFRRTKTLHDKWGNVAISLDNFDDELKNKDNSSVWSIMKIYNREDELIWEREEKSIKELEIERIENEMRKLADDLKKLKEVD